MFKLLEKILKYFAVYHAFQKYRNNLIAVGISTIFIIITLFVYADVVEFLKNKSLTDYLIHALIGKWFVIIACVLVIFIAIKPKKEVLHPAKKNKPIKTPVLEPDVPKSAIELEILKKKDLKTKGDLIIEEAKARKKLE